MTSSKVLAYTKSIVAGVAVVATVLQSALTEAPGGDITPNEYVKIAISVIAALGVYFLPNKGYVNAPETGHKTEIVTGEPIPPVQGI
jgi:multisubunit Na+/H+ antiporter MnhB subunit